MGFKENNDGGIEVNLNDRFYDDIELRVFSLIENKEIKILSQGSKSNEEFEKEFKNIEKKYNKEMKSLLRNAYKGLFNPIDIFEQFEFIMFKYMYIGLLTEESVEYQRNRFYNSLKYPSIDVKQKVMRLKEKFNKKFKLNG